MWHGGNFIIIITTTTTTSSVPTTTTTTKKKKKKKCEANLIASIVEQYQNTQKVYFNQTIQNMHTFSG